MSLTREELYERVWGKPMIAVAKDVGVSPNYLARVCASVNIPWPYRGYWAQLAGGQKPSRLPLPPARPGDQLAWAKARGLDDPPERRHHEKSAERGDTGDSQAQEPQRHPLIVGAREFFDIDC